MGDETAKRGKGRGPVAAAVTKPPSASRSGRAPRGTPPAVSHGTRVQFNVVCGRCGAEDTLPFVPKTQGEILCRACAENVFGPDWAHGRKVDKPQSYPFTCARCGREDTVPFEPRPGRELLCQPCFRGEEQSTTERLRQMKRVD